jgi:hypothetical protein
MVVPIRCRHGDTKKEIKMNVKKTAIFWTIAALVAFGCKKKDSSDNVDPEDSGIEDAGDTENNYPRRIAHLQIVHNCPGCIEAKVCNFKPTSDTKGAAFIPMPRDSIAHYTAEARLMAFAASVELDTCKYLTSKEQNVLSPSSELDSFLRAGTISITSEGSQWAALPMACEYEPITGGYPMVWVIPEGMVNYQPGDSISLKAEGGDDIAAFEVNGVTPEPLLLTAPSADENGKIQNIDTQKALTITWSGGEASTIVVKLESNWCSGQKQSMAVCRARNDGEFVISDDIIKSMDFGNFATIALYSDIEIPLSIPEIGEEEVYWAVGSTTYLTIFHDPEAEQTIPTDCGPMETGEVGRACEDESSCGNGCCLIQPDYFINGYCSIPNCESDESCPSDSKCFHDVNPLLVPYDSFCAKKCDSDADCRVSDEHWCHSIQKVCVPNLK